MSKATVFLFDGDIAKKIPGFLKVSGVSYKKIISY
jgi:hypothetical protein